MDKRKLIQIIEKELEELKVLSEEVAEDENDTSLIIELAISKARLLCQEFELLRELTAKDAAISTADSPEDYEVDEDEISDESISDPELEIVNFEESESEEITESDEEGEVLPNLDDENENEDFKETDLDSEDLEEEPELDEDDLTDDEDENESEEEYIEEEIEEEGLIEFGENGNDEENLEAEEPKPELNIEQTELKSDPQIGVREINIDDTDDDDLEPVKVSNVVDRPVMREIPKPEELIQEKSVTGEPLPKDRSLNETIGETKSTEPLLTSGPISSLRAAIGLNDRFLFIREIFGNNTDKYNTIIDQLDKLENQQQAVELLKANITLQKNETSMKFVDLLKRRFSK